VSLYTSCVLGLRPSALLMICLLIYQKKKKKKSYAEAVQGMDHTLSLNFQTMAGKSKVGEAALEKINNRNLLVDALSAELEEKEKAVMMTREELVGIGTVRDMLSEFKKDLKCLEDYLVGWTPPSVAVNHAKKGADFGQTKLRKEKPKPPVKFTYFRKKSARHTTLWHKIARPVSSPVSGPVQAIKFSRAVRMLEKGEKLGARPSPASPANLVILVNESRENPEAIVSGCLSPIIMSSVSECPSKEL
jgi:hypothetical protein